MTSTLGRPDLPLQAPAALRRRLLDADPALETLLGRKPTSLRDVLAAALAPAPQTDQE